jgi:hypothetical protein
MFVNGRLFRLRQGVWKERGLTSLSRQELEGARRRFISGDDEAR